MTAHQLAKHLLEQPDLLVVIAGHSSDDGFYFEVSAIRFILIITYIRTIEL